MKKYLVILIIWMLGSCSTSAPVQEVVIIDPILDSVLMANDSVTASVKQVTSETDSAVNQVLQTILQENHLLKQSSLITKVTVVHDTIMITVKERTNFWGKTKVAAMSMEALPSDSTTILQADSTYPEQQ